MQTIFRKGTFDAAHRVMNEKMKCFNLHGHTYLYEIHFGFFTMESIGYAIDFKEIKRVAMQFIDDFFDHATIVNPSDEIVIKTCIDLNSKYWVMTLNNGSYCNPTVENIAKELFVLLYLLMRDYEGLELVKIVLYETPNCACTCNKEDISTDEWENMVALHNEMTISYATEKGQVNYDDRKI